MPIPPNQELHIFESPAAVARAAADLLIRAARLRITEPGARFHVALSGGTTPRDIYERLRESDAQDVAYLQHTDYYWADERAVGNSHADSNVLLAKNGFLKPLGIPQERIHAPDGGAPDLSEEAGLLSDLLHKQMPERFTNGAPVLDFVFLGMGTDGHTASLFPRTEALDSLTLGYVANEVSQLNTRRLTLTYPMLNAARLLVLPCTGENKAKVLREVFSRGLNMPPKYPVEALKPRTMLWLLDRAAAAEIATDVIQRATNHVG